MKQLVTAVALALILGPAAYAQDKPVEAKAAEAVMSVDTPTFAKQVASSNAFEIQSSQIALAKLPDGALKAFAQQMIDDHTKAGTDFKASLEKAGYPPPSEALAPKHAAMIEQLKSAEGGDVAMLYTDMQFGAHKEAVALFMTFAKVGDDPIMKDFASRTLPTLEMHLMHVKRMVESPAG